VPDPNEVSAWRWISLQALRDWVATDREAFTAWFTYALDVLELEEPVENLR
jgi:isopentenyldiphosphate isomerase